MSRSGWIAVLLASLVLLVGGGAGLIVADPGGEDVGSVQVADLPTPSAPPTAPSEAATTPPAGGEPRPEAAATQESRTRPAPQGPPAVTRRSAGLDDVQGQAVVAPTELRVDAVGLAAPLDPVGVRPDGLMEIPDDGARAGWYRYGPAPGEPGSAVLAGHVDTSEGLGAMAALRDVELGDLVEVGMADGTTRRYEVVGRETIEKDELPVDELFDREGPERLTLVTCGGPWRSEASSYRDNVVVLAVPVDG